MSAAIADLASTSRSVPSSAQLAPGLVKALCQIGRSPKNNAHPQREVIGLLFGETKDGRLVAEKFKAFEDTGPRSDLARRERLDKTFETTLNEARKDRELSALRLVGWFSLREGTGLTNSDVDFHDRHFRNPEDLALIAWWEDAAKIALELYSKAEGVHVAGEVVRRQPAPIELKPRKSSWFPAALIFLFFAGITFAVLASKNLLTGDNRFVQALRALSPGPDLGLQVEHQDDHLLVSWNPRNPVATSAIDGTLQIVDGAQKREIHLDAEQVTDGSIVYRPTTSDVTFRLEVRSEQSSAIGSKRMQDLAGPVAANPPAPAITRNAPPPPPAVSPENATSAEAEPTASDFVPPKPLRQVMPNTRALSPDLITSETRVEVAVRVNRSGRVIWVHCVNPGGNVTSTLAHIALSAAQQWTFEPARLHAQRVEGEHTIVFEFHPEK